MVSVTVFTPTYNRGHLIPQVYECLQRQNCHDFEWLVVDDGSNDNTKDYFQSLCQQTNPFPIRYYYKENGGKHSAINYGTKKAQGILFLILDSDDMLTYNSISIILAYWNQVKDDLRFCGVCGRIMHSDGKLIGNDFRKEHIDMSYLDCRYKLGLKGDMIEVVRTDVMREYPFPIYKSEKFCPEALIWNRIGSKYLMRYFNTAVYYRDYIVGGLTDKIVNIRMKSPLGTMACYQELTKYDIPIAQKIKAGINFWRFAFCSNSSICRKITMIGFRWTLLLPIGYIIHIKDKIVNHEK